MAYKKGCLVQLNNTNSWDDDDILDLKYIRADSYLAYVNMQDFEPWTDAAGYLHRNAVGLKALKVEFETRAMLTNTELSELMSFIRSRYANEQERATYIRAYIPEYDDYVTQKGYIADFTPQIYWAKQIDDNNGILYYNPIKFSIVGGVYG